MENFYEKIERYILGELEGEVLADFENALKTDTELAQSVARHRAMMQRLEALRLRKKVQLVLEEDRIRPGGGIPKRVIWSIAVLLVMLAAAFWVFKQWSLAPKIEKEIPAENPLPEPKNQIENHPIAAQPEIPETIRPSNKKNQTTAQLRALAQAYHLKPQMSTIRDGSGNISASSTALERAQAAYAEKKYALALDQLRNEIFTENQEEALYLRANLRFMLYEYTNAARDFDGLKNSFQFKQEARWNFMLCQLALGYQENTRQLLTAMAADKDFTFHAKALELQARLNF
jgi:hypothetical protein